MVLTFHFLTSDFLLFFEEKMESTSEQPEAVVTQSISQTPDILADTITETTSTKPSLTVDTSKINERTSLLKKTPTQTSSDRLLKRHLPLEKLDSYLIYTRAKVEPRKWDTLKEKRTVMRLFQSAISAGNLS